MKISLRLLMLIAMMSILPYQAMAQQWKILPGATVGGLVRSVGGEVVDSDTTRLDDGLLVVTTYIQAGFDLYRCVEYVTEYQFELTRSACFQAQTNNPGPVRRTQPSAAPTAPELAPQPESESAPRIFQNFSE